MGEVARGDSVARGPADRLRRPGLRRPGHGDGGDGGLLSGQGIVLGPWSLVLGPLQRTNDQLVF